MQTVLNEYHDIAIKGEKCVGHSIKLESDRKTYYKTRLVLLNSTNSTLNILYAVKLCDFKQKPVVAQPASFCRPWQSSVFKVAGLLHPAKTRGGSQRRALGVKIKTVDFDHEQYRPELSVNRPKLISNRPEFTTNTQELTCNTPELISNTQELLQFLQEITKKGKTWLKHEGKS